VSLRSSVEYEHGDGEHRGDHDPEHPRQVEEADLEVHAHDPCEHGRRQENHRDQREHLHDVVRPLADASDAGSLQAAKTLGALPPHDELLNDTIQLVDQAFNRAA
jgi:hypothetical protein